MARGRAASPTDHGEYPGCRGWPLQHGNERPPDHNLWAPRIGFAYQANPRTVIRGGYGRSFDIGVFGSIFGHVVTQKSARTCQSKPHQQWSQHSGLQPRRRRLLSSPQSHRTGSSPFPTGDNADNCDDPNRFPTIDAWNLTLQRQLNSSISLTTAYVGNKGTHTFSRDGQTTNPNQPAVRRPASESSTGQTICWNPNPVGTGLNQESDLLQRYYAKYGWAQGLTDYHNAFNTHYNALRVAREKHLHARIAVLCQLRLAAGLQRWRRPTRDQPSYRLRQVRRSARTAAHILRQLRITVWQKPHVAQRCPGMGRLPHWRRPTQYISQPLERPSLYPELR